MKSFGFYNAQVLAGTPAFHPPGLAWPGHALLYLISLTYFGLCYLFSCVFRHRLSLAFVVLLYSALLCSALLGHSSFAASAKTYAHTHTDTHTHTRYYHLDTGHATKYQSLFPLFSLLLSCLSPSLPSLSLARRLKSLQSPSLSAGSGGHPVLGSPLNLAPPSHPVRSEKKTSSAAPPSNPVLPITQPHAHSAPPAAKHLLRPYKHCLPRDVPVTYPRTYIHTFAHTPHRDYPKAEPDCEIHIPISPLPTSLRAPLPYQKQTTSHRLVLMRSNLYHQRNR